jgi:hypothetical protein
MRALTPDELQTAQILTGVTMAALIGCRFVPEERRQLGRMLIAGLYGLSAVCFLIIILAR